MSKQIVVTIASLMMLLSACTGQLSAADETGSIGNPRGNPRTGGDDDDDDDDDDDVVNPDGGVAYDSGSGGSTDPDPDPPDTGGADPGEGWPEGNEYSWDGQWDPSDSDFPMNGLLDNEYGDGHQIRGVATPVLPPGAWDYQDGMNDLANWRNFDSNIGHFERLMADGRHFGWRLVGNDPNATHYTAAAAYFEGTPGTDILDLGPRGIVNSFSAGNLGDGPDVLVFQKSYSLDFRTGTSASGRRDNDLIVAGCGNNGDGSFDVITTTIHTGPGTDWMFVRDIDRAAVDLGNGNGGRTDASDPNDGDDLVVLRGNTHDFRVFGGAGNDVAVWYADENVQTSRWLGPNFFGGGGKGSAIWDSGTDRLVLAVPTSTRVVSASPTPQGALLVKATTGAFVDDPPTAADPFATYCVECGTGPGGQKTVIMEYHSADGSVFSGYFFVTSFEEVQIGVGSGASVYRINSAAGTATLDDSLEPIAVPEPPSSYCQ